MFCALGEFAGEVGAEGVAEGGRDEDERGEGCGDVEGADEVGGEGGEGLGVW